MAKLTYHEHVLQDYQRSFLEEAKSFTTAVFGHGLKLEPVGPGLEALWMLDCLRSLNALYYLIVAHKEAIRVSKGEMR